MSKCVIKVDNQYVSSHQTGNKAVIFTDSMNDSKVFDNSFQAFLFATNNSGDLCHDNLENIYRDAVIVPIKTEIKSK